MEKLENKYKLDIQQIRGFLPHRSPFLLVDRILEIHPSAPLSELVGVGTRVVGLKNVTFNEPFFQGHFPDFSIMPGVLILEAMAQVATFSVYPNLSEDQGQYPKDFQCILVGVDGARFRKPVVPGDTLKIETEVTKCRGGKLYGFQCSAFVDGQRVAEAELMANLTVSPRVREEKQ